LITPVWRFPAIKWKENSSTKVGDKQMSIVDDNPLNLCCCVCGKNITPLAGGIPGVFGVGTCSKCGKKCCAEHLSGTLEKTCTNCTGKFKEWCGTPKSIFPGL